MTKHDLEEPGTTIYLVPHFHMDPVWWNTQAASVSELPASDWSGSPRMGFQRSGFDALRSHVALAERDVDYRFCVAEVDLLAPLWDHEPRERRRLQRLVDTGRVEVVGGTYNSPCTTLTSTELTRRNLALGLRFQRGVMGADVTTAWQLDAFGHDPGFPGLLADAGVDAVVFARGPYGPWGPMLASAFSAPQPPAGAQFPTEFEWIAPNGRSVLGVYLAAHYSTGYALDRCATLEDAARFVLDLAAALRDVSASPHLVLLVGTDLAPPARWITELPRQLARRQPWPRVICSLPRDAIAAVRNDLASSARRPWPQTRDMNPVYTGKDVSYIDTKQAHRACENVLADVEAWSAIADVAGIAGSPAPPGLEDAWRLLVFGAHHDALTGTESDQVYLDLLAGWRRAHDLASQVRDDLLHELSRRASPTQGPGITVVVHNSSRHERADVVTVDLGVEHLGALATPGLRAVDAAGSDVAMVVDAHRRDAAGALVAARITLLVTAVPGLGARTVHLVPADSLPEWIDDDGVTVRTGRNVVESDPVRGGCLTSWRRDGVELLTPGRVAAELVLVPEHATHPDLGEGPWHLMPCGPGTGTAHALAAVTRRRSAVGERLVAEGSLEGAAWRHTISLWHGIDRVDGEISMDSLVGADHLLRLRWPCHVPGALPVVEAGDDVIGRGFALLDVDAATHPWTLDSSCNTWFGSSVTARARIDEGGALTDRAIGVAEVVMPDDRPGDEVRDLVVALVRAGVTSTVTTAGGARYGALGLDSNAPDVRIAVGIHGSNGFTTRVVDAAGAAYRDSLRAQLHARGAARLWVPSLRPLRDVWVPGLDVRGDRDLPVLVIEGIDGDALVAEIARVVAEIEGDQAIHVAHPGSLPRSSADDAPADRSVAMFNRGTPSCAIDIEGTLHVTLLRACTAWPAGQWIDPPTRALPDATSFQSQHWSHTFDYAVAAGDGDWRRAALAERAHQWQRPLTAVVAPITVVDAPPPPRTLPRFSRWWVQNRGPVPASGAPVAVRLLPPDDGPGGRWRASIVASSMPAGLPFTGAMRWQVTLPVGWRASAGVGELRMDGAEAHEVTFDVEPPTPLPPGHHVVAVSVDCGESGHVYDANVCSWDATAPPLEVAGLPDVVVEPGADVRVHVTVVNNTTGELPAEIDVLSPWGTWHLVAEGHLDAVLAPMATTMVPVRFRSGVGSVDGSWWWGTRVVAGPLVAYAPTARLAVVPLFTEASPPSARHLSAQR